MFHTVIPACGITSHTVIPACGIMSHTVIPAQAGILVVPGRSPPLRG
jgi:hypothetical protein